MKVNNIQDWLDSHIGGDCNEASDCLIMLAQVIQKEVTDLASENKTLRELAQGNSKSEDTSLDDIFDNHGQTIGYGDYYQTETLADIKIEIMAWHKAERAKLFEQIRSELKLADGGGEVHVSHVCPQDNVDCAKFAQRCQTRTWQLEALTRLEQK